MTRTLMIVAGALLVPAIAHAQLFKCTGPDGKVVYSDTRCEASSKGSLKVNPNSSTPSEKELADAAAKAEAAKAAAAGGTPSATGGGIPPAPAGTYVGGRYQPSSADKDRIRDLEVSQARLGASDEQKTAASLEVSAIRSGLDSRMPSEAKSQRDSLTTDLSSTDAKKRKDSLNKLRELYSNY